jgi:hypothetical protein
MRKNVRGSVAREGIYTRPARCHVTYHVHVAKLKETNTFNSNLADFVRPCSLGASARVQSKLCTQMTNSPRLGFLIQKSSGEAPTMGKYSIIFDRPVQSITPPN